MTSETILISTQLYHAVLIRHSMIMVIRKYSSLNDKKHKPKITPCLASKLKDKTSGIGRYLIIAIMTSICATEQYIVIFIVNLSFVLTMLCCYFLYNFAMRRIVIGLCTVFNKYMPFYVFTKQIKLRFAANEMDNNFD
jgi:hypothetical protein